MVTRDNAYFERRLQKEHPQVYADWKAGKFKTLTAARHSIGLGKRRTRFQELINAWEKASTQERDDFLDYLRKQGVQPASVAAAAAAPTVAPAGGGATGGSRLGYQVAVVGKLTPQAKDRILEIVQRRGLLGQYGAPRYGAIMQELIPPFKPQNMALAQAIRNGTRLKPDMVRALEQWLINQKHV
ncbi:hypothetical protein [Pararhodobacter sp. SW119]|uniref:hypothetical protein n=1 Tax=Pararhodobacter sp. SW119 TaxID=2780075 RepID=UPI001ADEDDDE|nr:hypothetical protein [Pararhodobacter sp. SW119]